MAKPLSLDERLKKSLDEAKPKAPDMNPRSRPPKEEEEVLPDLREVVRSAATRLKILRLVSQSVEYQRAESEAKKLREPITKALKELIASECPEGKFMVDGNRVVTFSTTRNTLNRTRLMDKGVSIQILNECTDKSVSVSLKITPSDANGEDAE